jgi:hypothetical protein
MPVFVKERSNFLNSLTIATFCELCHFLITIGSVLVVCGMIVTDLYGATYSLEIPDDKPMTVSQIRALLAENHRANFSECVFCHGEAVLEDKDMVSPPFSELSLVIFNRGMFPLMPFHAGDCGRSHYRPRYWEFYVNHGEGEIISDDEDISVPIMQCLRELARLQLDLVERDNDFQIDRTDSANENDRLPREEEEEDSGDRDEEEEGYSGNSASENLMVLRGDFGAYRRVLPRLHRSRSGNHAIHDWDYIASDDEIDDLDGEEDAGPDVGDDGEGPEESRNDERYDAEIQIKLQPGEEDVIVRLLRTGLDRGTVLQVFEACDHNEEAAFNCLVSMS